jgi:LPXTG-motif cell wall-anchored protein
MRLLNVYLFSGHEWASWALLGLFSLVGGLVVWRKRRAVPTREATR